MSERVGTRIGWIVLAGVLLWLPLYAEGFWLQTGLFAMSAAIAAIGLTLLVGRTGQLSLGHAFFVAIGAYGYCYLAGGSEAIPGSSAPSGLGLPTAVALIGAVLLAGMAGALFAPFAGRLKGIYLGLASVGLVFLGLHILHNATGITGGFNGRDAAPFSLGGFAFSDTRPDDLVIAGVPFGQLERLWYLGLALVLFSWWFARNLLQGRPGRALEAVRDSEVAAGAMGVDVRLYRGAAFVLSSMYAGLGGVLLALAFGRIVPESFGVLYSIDFLVIVVLGGLGSVRGAILGAVVVTALPQILSRYAADLPFVGEPGSDGLQGADAARLLYGAAVVAVLIFIPGGLAGAGRLITTRQTKESTA